ncbi:MAG TPA: phage tail protein [Duganella sp.]|nr:phage tail protein [Duganella sp.]
MNDSLPVGAIVPYAGPVNNPNDPQGAASYPDYRSLAYQRYLQQRGWLLCDGATVLVAQYPDLFRAIGFIYGQAGPGQFMLPDYRGRVLRGVNLDAQGPDNLPRDPQATERTASGSGGWSGNQVGSVQDDAFQAHEHDYQKAIAGGAAAQGKPVFGQYQQAQTEGAVMPKSYTPAISMRAAPETRVKNAYVNYIIKYRGLAAHGRWPLPGIIDSVDGFDG